MSFLNIYKWNFNFSEYIVCFQQRHAELLKAQTCLHEPNWMNGLWQRQRHHSAHPELLLRPEGEMLKHTFVSLHLKPPDVFWWNSAVGGCQLSLKYNMEVCLVVCEAHISPCGYWQKRHLFKGNKHSPGGFLIKIQDVLVISKFYNYIFCISNISKLSEFSLTKASLCILRCTAKVPLSVVWGWTESPGTMTVTGEQRTSAAALWSLLGTAVMAPGCKKIVFFFKLLFIY